MPAPLFKVEVAFANGPNDAAPTYTDISQYVRRYPPLTYSRGNTDETQQLQAGQMSFTVDNTDGRFTVGSSASTSAWGTALKIRRPVRLSLWDGAAYQVAWTGTVDDWGAGWLGGVKGLSRVTCSDRVAAAGRIDLPDLIGGEIIAASPSWYYSLGDSAGNPALTAGNAVPQTALSWLNSGSGGSYAYGTAGPGADGITGATTSNPTASGFYLTGYIPVGLGSTTTTTLTAWIKVPTATAATQPIVTLSSSDGLSLASLYVDTAGRIVAQLVSTTTGTVTGNFIADGSWHHVALVANSGTVTLYVDGASTGSAAYTNGSVAFIFYSAFSEVAPTNFASCSLAHIAGWSSALSATTIANIATAGSTTATEATGARWNRLCRIAGLSSTWYAADAGSGALLQQATKGTSLVAALQAVAKVEQGYAFATAGGVLTLKARETRFNKTSTLTIAPQTAEPALEFPANDAYLVNVANIDSADAAGVDVRDATSVTDNGPYRFSDTIPVAGATAQALNYGQWLVYRYKTPTARARGLAINGTTKASSITATQLLALDVNSRITLSPLTGPAPASSVQVFIDGVAGTVGDTWEVAFNTSPTTGLDGLVLDTSTLDNAASILLY